MPETIAYKWQIELKTDQLDMFDMLIEDLGASVDVSFNEDKEDLADVSVFIPAVIEVMAYKSQLESVATACGLSTDITLDEVYAENWQAKAYEGLAPIEIGSFFVYNQNDVVVPEDKISIHIPAELVFGSGGHATTEGCLALYEEIAKTEDFKTLLDMGTGTGILAMAANLLKGTKSYAVDIEEDAVKATIDNADFNKANIVAEAGDGFKANLAMENAPYDLIFANILKNPLLMMKDDLYAQLETGGYAIISGFDESQQQEVLEAYRSIGFDVVKTHCKDSWIAALIYKK